MSQWRRTLPKEQENTLEGFRVKCFKRFENKSWTNKDPQERSVNTRKGELFC